MIPVRLQVRGFLSYKENVDLSFEGFDLACISGNNGAGKSSLLDAITWVLFGKARRNDDEVINNTSPEAEVIYVFAYEDSLYRVQRIKARNRPVILEFQIKNGQDEWKPLTERTFTETQNKIIDVLHLDYDTFINASFFLQGKADEFTQKNSSQRKEILAGILGMDIWEGYQENTRALRRLIDARIAKVEGSLAEIEQELAQEEQRKADHEKAEAELLRLEEQRKEQQKVYEQGKQMADMLEEQSRLLAGYEEEHGELLKRAQVLEQTLAERRKEEESYQAVLSESAKIEKEHLEREKLLEALRKLDGIASRYFTLQQKQAVCEKKLAMEESRLKQEVLSLEKERDKSEQMKKDLVALRAKQDSLSKEQTHLRVEVKKLEPLKKEEEELQAQQNVLIAENKNLKEHMHKLKERLERLKAEKGSACPLCGQALSEAHRQQVIAEIEMDGKKDAQVFHANEKTLNELLEKISAVKNEWISIQRLDGELRKVEQNLGISMNETKRLEAAISAWEKEGETQLQKLQKELGVQNFAGSVRDEEQDILKEILELEYDQDLHETLRHQEQEGRKLESLYQELLIARNRLEPLSREIETLTAQHTAILKEAEARVEKQQKAQLHYQELEQNVPNVQELETRLKELTRQENQQRSQVGAALQMVEVIARQKVRKQKALGEISSLSEQLSRLQLLERAFGRDGIQALLMEEALPQMELQANDTLNRLSAGTMSVRFETEREYKDKKRDDKMQVLDILINDAEGVRRPYDLFSGGEAFRINFAIRLALSKVLAQRAGARLQLLVIDEGFGSQDEEGRQRLIEAINLIRPDFKKILVITHLEELKDAFQARIEVRKTRKGSQVEVITQ